MDIIEWIRSLPAWFLSIVEPIYLGFGIDAWISLHQFLFVLAVAIFILVVAVLSYADQRD